MKKNILIIVLLVLLIFSMIHAFIKADEAEKRILDAERQKEHVEDLHDEVIQITRIAEDAAAEALRQKHLAEQALKDCESK